MSDYSDMETDPSTGGERSTYRLPESAIRTIDNVAAVTGGKSVNGENGVAHNNLPNGNPPSSEAALRVAGDTNATPMDTSGDTTPPRVGGDADVLMHELEKFIRETLAESSTVCMSDLRSRMSLYTARVPTAHVFSAGVSDKMMEEAVVNVGGFRLKNQVN